MNQKMKRSAAALLAMMTICSTINTGGVRTSLQWLDADQTITASAAGNAEYISGKTNSRFYAHYANDGYSLYFTVQDRNAKTAVVSGCWTRQERVFVSIPDTIPFEGSDYKIVGIADDTFMNQTGMITCNIGRYVETIGNYAFYGCSNMSYCYVNRLNGSGDMSLKTIGNSAFQSCSSLSGCSFVSRVKNIGNSAFSHCSSLNELYMQAIESLGVNAFAYCYSLAKVDLSESKLTTIPDSAFAESGSTIDSGKWLMPSTLKKIGYKAFYHVTNMKQIDIYNVTSIGSYAFADCHNLKYALAGANLTSIGQYAFYGCDPMEFFVCKNPKVSIGTKAIGFDHKREYTGKKSNFKVWGCSGGGTAKTYASNNGFVYSNTESAPAAMKNDFKPYMWSTGNNEKTFGDKNGNYLFMSAHTPYVTKDDVGKDWNGSCYGMAAASTLTYNGQLAVKDFSKSYNCIYDIPSDCSEFTKSFVNSLWSNYQSTPDYKLKGTYFDAEEQEMLHYIEYITYGADVAAVAFASSGSEPAGHANVCLGMEFKENASDRNTNPQWNNMDARILLYDVNWFSFKDDYCLYVNLETGEWGKEQLLDGKSKFVNYVYSSTKNPKFVFEIMYEPDSIISNSKTPQGRLAGMNLVNALLRIDH